MKKKIKISKGVIFLLIGILFLFVTFYNIQELPFDNDYSFVDYIRLIIYSGISEKFYDFFKPTIFNYLFSLLFIALGALEIKEAYYITEITLKEKLNRIIENENSSVKAVKDAKIKLNEIENKEQ